MWSLLSESYLLILPFEVVNSPPPHTFFCFLTPERISFLFLAHVFNHPLTLLYISPPRRSLKLECEKLASEKTEMQRHYVMVSLNRFWVFGQRPGCGFRFGRKEEQRGAVLTLLSSLFSQYYEMSYGLNIEMHKQVGNCWFTQTVAMKFHTIFLIERCWYDSFMAIVYSQQGLDFII